MSLKDIKTACIKKRAMIIKITAGILCIALLAVLFLRGRSWYMEREAAQLLALVNDWNSVDSAGFKPKLEETEGGFLLDSRCAAALRQMLTQCRADGFSPKITGAYVSRQEQEKLYENERLRLAGLGQNPEMASLKVQRPGWSENELGLSVNIKGADEWLTKNAGSYGFIQRYPEGAESITGHEADSEICRYVGVAPAELISHMNICLEEYIAMFYSREAVIIFENN